MIRAVESDQPEQLRNLLEDHMFDIQDLARGLQLAAEKGHSACAQLLLEAGANPNIHSLTGFTPIIIAARYGHADIVTMMTDAGCNINKATLSVRATALHWAASNGHYHCVKRLIDKKCNLESQTIHGRTALMLAAHNGHGDVVEQLISAGSCVNETDCDKSTALHHAATTGSTQVIRILLDNGAKLNHSKRGGETAAALAVMHGRSRALKCLIAAKCDITVVIKCMGLLHWAAYGGDRECCQRLIEKGLNCNARTSGAYYGADFVVESGVTPLMLAARSGCVDAIQCIVEAGANVDEADCRNYTALHYCARYNDVTGSCAHALLRSGADPDGQTVEGGASPLHLAMRMNNVKVVKQLLQANCNLYILFDGITAFDLAMKRCERNVIRMMLEAGFRPAMATTSVQQCLANSTLPRKAQLFGEIQDMVMSVPSLKLSTRICIRNSLGRKVLQDIEYLPLPPTLLRFVGIEDLEWD